MSAPQLKGYPVVVSCPLFWGDMDALGHANNVRFFRWFENARLAYFERIGTMPAPGTGPILAHTSCDYLRPLIYPADLLVGARLEKLGRTSMTIEHGLARADNPDEPVARGRSVVVMVNYATGEKLPITDEVRQAIERLEQAR